MLPFFFLLIFYRKKGIPFIFIILIVSWTIPKIDIITYATHSYSKGIHTVYPKFIAPGTFIFEHKEYDFPFLKKLYFHKKRFCKELYLDSKGEITILQAVLLGNKSFLKNRTKDMFTITGTLHLLAISGLHVAIIIGLIFSIFFFLPLKMRFIITNMFLLFFIVITGFKITVIRASLFAIIILTALFFDTKTNLKKLTLFIAAIFLAINPHNIRDISFILSFCAVIGILYFIKEKSPLHVNFLNASLGATLFTAPFILFFFGNFNFLSILNTLVLLPFFYFLILLGVMGIFAKSYLIAPVSILETFIRKTVTELYHLTYPFFFLNRIHLYIFILSLAIIFIFMFTKKKPVIFLLMILPFIKIFPHDISVFPNMIRSKGFIKISEQHNEIFFKGIYSDFKYRFLPLVAKSGRKIFDYGTIHIYDGKNLYVKTKNKNLKDICINRVDSGCKIVYFTKANKISKKQLSNNKLFIIYQNRIKSPCIVELKGTKCVTIKGKEVTINDPICK